MSPTTTTESIKARGLGKAFGDVVAVDGLDFDAVPGRCLGILGPNGAGKTTTIEMLEGLVRPDRGVIVLFGLTWEHEQKPNDSLLEFVGLKVYVDPLSAMYLEEVSIDYVDSLSGSGFKIDNPKSTGTCGCGSSFSV